MQNHKAGVLNVAASQVAKHVVDTIQITKKIFIFCLVQNVELLCAFAKLTCKTCGEGIQVVSGSNS